MHYSLKGENETAFYKTVICYIEVPSKAGLTVHVKVFVNILLETYLPS